MAKKSTVHNHIDNVTVNIDYDELAKAILEKQKKVKGKGKKRMSVRQHLMAWCNGILYAGLYSYAICKVIDMWRKYIRIGEPSLYMCIVCSVIGISLAVLLFLAQQETMNDSEEEIIAHFNTNIAFVALIAAIVALVKG